MATPEQTSKPSTSLDRAAQREAQWQAHQARRRIIEAPFLSLGVHTYGRSCPWAGALVDRGFAPGSSRGRRQENEIVTITIDDLIDLMADR